MLPGFTWPDAIDDQRTRLEMRLLFDGLLKRIESVELAGELRTMASLMVSGLKSLPIRFKAH